MTGKGLIKSYINIHDHEYTGFRQKFLIGVKDLLVNILQKGLAKEGIEEFDLMFPSQVKEIEDLLMNLIMNPTFEFLKFGSKHQKKFIGKIIEYFAKKNPETYKDLIEKGNAIMTDLQNNNYNEGKIHTFLTEATKAGKAILDHDKNVKSSLYKIIKSKEIAEVLEQDITKLKTEAKNLARSTRIVTIQDEAYKIIHDNCKFLNELSVNGQRSLDIIAKALEHNQYVDIDRVLNMREDSLHTANLEWLYNGIKKYNDILQNPKMNKQHKEVAIGILENVIAKTKDNIESYVQRSLSIIVRNTLHVSLTDKFDKIDRIIRELLVFSKLPEEHPLRKHIDILKTEGVLGKETTEILAKHNNTITTEEINNIAKDMIRNLELTNEQLKAKEKEEAIERQKKLDKRSKLRKMRDTVLDNAEKTVFNVLGMIKGAPRMILLATLIILSVVLKPILRLIVYIIRMIRGHDGGSVGGDGREGSDNEDDSDRDDNSIRELFENETLARILSDLNTSGIRDLVNRAFTGNLLSMSDKRNNLTNERDLLSEGKDILKNIDIINYPLLDSNLLVGEVFMQLQTTRWKKEKIDHTNKHILEQLNDDIFNEDYSFFTKAHDWSVHELEDNQYPGLVLQPAAVIKGKNSIVCPRGYIPVLSPESKTMLKKNNINYELYCIKNLGYYFLTLNKSIPKRLKIYYKRYGDTQYNGIFFNTQENQPEGGYVDIAEILQEPLIQVEDLPKEMHDIVYDQQFVTEPERVVDTYTDYLGSTFSYSTKRVHTTHEYAKHPSYLIGMANTKVGDCKNVNTMNIALLRHHKIQSQMCGGYVYDNSQRGYEGHAITEANIDGKCLLADATPSERFNDTPDEQITKEKSEFQKQFEKRKDAVDDAKAAINAFFGQYADQYNKWREKRKKRKEEEMRNKLQVDELDIERKRNELITELGKVIVEFGTNNTLDIRIVEVFLHYIQNLPNSAILRKSMPHETYISYIKAYLAKLELWKTIMNIIVREGNPEDLQELHKELNKLLAHEFERVASFNTALMKANNRVGSEYTRDEIFAAIIKHNKNIRSILEDNPKYGMDPLYSGEYSQLVNICMSGDIFEQFMPIDISPYVEKHQKTIEKYTNTPENDEGENDEGEKNENEDQDDNKTKTGNNKDKKEEGKKLLAPIKAKTILLSAFKILGQNFMDQVGKNGRVGNFNDIYRFKLLIQNSIDLSDHIDEGFWLQRSKKDVEEVVKAMESIHHGDPLEKFLNFAPIGISEHFFSWKPLFQMNLLIRIYKGDGFDKSRQDNKELIGNYMKLFGTEDPFAKELQVLCEEYRRNGEVFYAIHNAQDSTWAVQVAARSKMENLSSYNSDLRLSDFDIKKAVDLHKAELLSKYNNNHIARLSILTTQKEVDHKDISLIKESIEELGGQKELSEKEKIMIEKAIFHMIFNIMKFRGSQEYSSSFFLQKETGFSNRDLEKSLNAIKSDFVVDVVSKVHALYAERIKLLKKNNLVESQERSMRQNADELIEIFEICKYSLKNYTLQNKNSFGVTVLEFKINNLIRSLGKLRPIYQGPYGGQFGGDM